MTEETKFQLLQLYNSIIRCCVCVDSSTKYEKKKATFVISAYYYRTIYNSCFVFLFASPWKQNKIVLLTHIQRCSFSVFYFPHSQEKCLCANPNRSRNIISLCPSVLGNTHSFIYIDLLTAKRNLIGSLYEATAIDRFSITFSFLWQMPDGEFYCRRDVIVCASIFDSYV